AAVDVEFVIVTVPRTTDPVKLAVVVTLTLPPLACADRAPHTSASVAMASMRRIAPREDGRVMMQFSFRPAQGRLSPGAPRGRISPGSLRGVAASPRTTGRVCRLCRLPCHAHPPSPGGWLAREAMRSAIQRKRRTNGGAPPNCRRRPVRGGGRRPSADQL